MKELLIISGKGGTGKTSIVGSFAALAENKVLTDCDVDAADLHLLLHPEIREKKEFYASRKAFIHQEKCVQCGRCTEACRFGAIQEFRVNPIFCEGCGVCFRLCPAGAITMEDHLSGHWFISDTRYGLLVHARLGIAGENSGKLVAEVRQAAKAMAEKKGYQFIIIDGPPGIGCPVISSLSGVDLSLIITEPTVAGKHDLQRVLQLTSHFNVRAMVCINKYDLDEEKSREIEQYCLDAGIEVAGKIPFDEAVTQAIVQGVPPVEHTRGAGAKAIETLWARVQQSLTIN
ncbi:(4Fe-4S)-binding protein [Clostridiales bacterium PH28_bin88]|nr:(4Fe-4S)-binding protein [Clostridiales bacterium PH28_bin88]